MPFDVERAFGGLTERRAGKPDDVERHHAGEHDPPRQGGAQGLLIADAVLETDDDRLRGCKLCQRFGRLDSVARLDRDQDQCCTGEALRVGPVVDILCFDTQIGAEIVGQVQAVGGYVLGQPLAAYETHLRASSGKPAADIAADAARAEDADLRLRLFHVADAPTVRLRSAVSDGW